MKKKIVIIGGVAGGANCATRARRLNESAEIIILERSGFVSFANCGLPYHIGGDIAEREALLLNSPTSFQNRYNITARCNSEVIKINPAEHCVEVRNTKTGELYSESYDDLVLSMGAAPIMPALPGLQLDGVFVLRSVEDMDSIQSWVGNKLNTKGEKPRALVVGGGYVGLEMVEQLHRRGFSVSLLEAAPQVLTPLDPEMAILIVDELTSQGVGVHLGEAITGVERLPSGALAAKTSKSASHEADLIILALGVKPESKLAREAGLTIGARESIVVNDFLQTSVGNIWAVGDVIGIKNMVTNEVAPIQLAGPANRQGRLVAENILSETKKSFCGAIGTSIVRVFDQVASSTGANEKTLQRLSRTYKTLYLYPNSHAGYYPGASPLAMKVLIEPTSRKLLGAQIVGKDGVDKRIDLLATAIKTGLTVDDLADLELSYAPPFGSAKDPINMVGMAAQNMLDGLVEVVSPSQIEGEVACGAVLLDVRDPDETEKGVIPDAITIPLNQLRRRKGELPAGKRIIVYCASAQRSYNAARLLSQSGFSVANLTGAFKAWKQYCRSQETAAL